MHALVHDHFKAADLLLKAGSSLGQVDKGGYTPLHKFAKQFKAGTVEWLLNAGADIDRQSVYGWNPLLEASESNLSARTTVLLLAHGAYTEHREKKNGRTALWQASSKGNLEIVKELIAGNANLNVVDLTDGNTPLAIAAANGHWEVVRLHLDTERVYLESRDRRGNTALLLACMNRHYECAKVLLEYKANPSARNKDSWTPLHEAIQHKHKDLVQLLLSYKSNLEIHALTAGHTPLLKAVHRKNLEIVRMLVESKADIEAYDKFGKKAIDIAAEAGELEVVRFLLDAGASKDGGRNIGGLGPDNELGWTPLMRAARAGHRGMQITR